MPFQKDLVLLYVWQQQYNDKKIPMEEDLQRFITAQEGKTIHGNTLYEQALIEIEEGKPDFEC